jgi:hypothetical protein
MFGKGNNLKISSGRIHLLALSISELDRTETLEPNELGYLVSLKAEVFTQELFEEVLRGGISSGLLSRTSAGALSLTSVGRRTLQSAKVSDEKGLKLRVLRGIILSTRRDLVRLAFSGLDEFRLRPSDELECFEQLGLADYVLSDEARAWWISIQTAGADFESSILKAVGDRAELASIRYEEQRLKELLFTPQPLDWVSRDTDLAGFDILSYSGEDPDPMERIPIEVKKLSRSHDGRLFFFISRNEFEVASRTKGYRFHLWELRTDHKSATLWIPELQSVFASTPLDTLRGRWETCSVFLDGLRDFCSKHTF